MGCCREHWWGGVESAAPLPRATKRSAQRNSLCNRICDYMRVCVYASVCICECVYACVCVYTHGCVYMRLCVYPSVFICLFLQCVRADNCSALFHTLSRCIMHIISVYCSPLSRSRFRLSYRFGLHGFNLCQPSTLLTTFNIKVLQKLSVFPTNTNTNEKKEKKENIKKNVSDGTDEGRVLKRGRWRRRHREDAPGQQAKLQGFATRRVLLAAGPAYWCTAGARLCHGGSGRGEPEYFFK